MPKVLLADDEPVTRRVIEAMLRREGFEVVSVEDGAEAISAIADERFDLVITDRNMPVTDGVALVQHLTSAGNDVPVIMITASAEAAEAEALGSGARAFLTKPISSRELAATLRKVLNG